MTEQIQEAAATESVEEATPTTLVDAPAEPAKDLIDAAPAAEAKKPAGDFDFKAHIPEEFKDAKSLQDIQDFDSLIKSYVSAQELVGKKVADMSPEDIARYNEKLGAPKDPRDYKFSSEEFNANAGLDWYRVAAKEAGLTNDQADALISKYSEQEKTFQANLQEEAENTAKAQVEELKETFGYDFDKEINKAKKAINYFGGEDLVNIIKEAGLGNNPTLIKAFQKASSLLNEDKIVTGSSPAAKSVRDVENEIASLRADPEFAKALSNVGDPATQKRAQDKLMELYAEKHNFKK
jgi:hypothetical protein